MPFYFGSSRPPAAGLAPQIGLALMGRLRRSQSDAATEQGLTLIECIVAIIIVALTVTAITPPIFLATATRIQSRRAEQANTIAQAEVDRVRTLIERGGYKEAALPNLGTGAAPTNTITNYLMSPAQCASAQNYPVYVDPSPTVTSPPNPVNASALVQVDVSGDCIADFVMQTFRRDDCKATTALPAAPPDSFTVGVRVYHYTPGETLGTLEAERANLAMTQGQRDRGSARRPMAALYSRVARNDSATAMQCAAR
jgi:prepilin-type N-terminal cleavage/methylation domain-containing protein